MEELEIIYELAKLPSPQHRAGLAGLVLMVQYLPNVQHLLPQREGAIIELQNYNEFGVTLRLNLEGLKMLFDLAYQAYEEERSTETKIKKYDRVEEVEVLDKKDKSKSTYGFDESGNFGDLKRLGKVGTDECDLPGNEFWVGGEIVRNMEPEEKTRLDDAGVHLYANPEQLFNALADAFLLSDKLPSDK
ncbi:MAG: hypothetical protein KME64_14185 [Scytonematopsis contorta HA4267-MV1]|jgi:hypothetical protein|nr:hypothetical protein [Scytonematopsis contorta HA4267-MV1]